MSFGSDMLGKSGFTGVLSKSGLVEGTAANTIQILAPNGAGVDFAIDGIASFKADTDSIAMTALPVQAADTKCLYLIQITAAGVVSMKKGNEESTVDLTAGKKVLNWPMPDANNVPLGGYKIATVAVTFTNGTTDLSAAGITDTFYDFVVGMPLMPQTS